MEKQLDLTYLKENLDEDEGSLKEMVDLIFRELSGRMEDLGRAVNNNQPEEAFSIAHSVKSSLKMLGLYRILQHIEAIEAAGKNHDNLMPYKDAMTQAQALLQMAHDEIREWK